MENVWDGFFGICQRTRCVRLAILFGKRAFFWVLLRTHPNLIDRGACDGVKLTAATEIIMRCRIVLVIKYGGPCLEPTPIRFQNASSTFSGSSHLGLSLKSEGSLKEPLIQGLGK